MSNRGSLNAANEDFATRVRDQGKKPPQQVYQTAAKGDG
jgi:hypothetical protein